MIIFVGSSLSGKTHLMKNILIDMLDQGKFKFGVVFCTTAFNNTWDVFPKEVVLHDYSEEWLSAYLKLLTKKFTGPGDKWTPEPSFMVFDDMIGSIPLEKPFTKKFLSTFRHFGITAFVSTQHIHKISTLHREQASYVFVFRLKTAKSIEAVFESFCGDLNNKNDFKDVLAAHTRVPYSALFIDCFEPDDENKYKSVLARKDIPQRKYHF